MVSWGWVVFALFAGAVFGMFFFAYMEVARQADKPSQRKDKK